MKDIIEITSESIEKNGVSKISRQKAEIIKKNKMIIEAIRRCRSNDKTLIAKTARMSWPTVKSFLSSNNGEMGLVDDSGDSYRLNSTYALFLGIAVGALETKVVLIDLNFDTVTSEFIRQYNINEFIENLKGIDGLASKPSSDVMVCFETENSLDYISKLCNESLRVALEFFGNHKSLNLLGVGITFPGIIGKDDLKISFCPNISCLNEVYVLQLLYSDIIEKLNEHSISLSIAHDTAAITVYEKENLYKSQETLQYVNMENVVCLYMGMGLGCGVIINNQLLSGKNNSIGEIGHIPAPYFEEAKKIEEAEVLERPQCYCNEQNCLEKSIRYYVFDSLTPEGLVDKTTPEYLERFHIDHPDNYALFKKYIRFIFTILINMFNPDLIILSGKIFNSIPALKKDMYMLKQSSGIRIPATSCSVIGGSDRPDCVAIGAGIMSYYKLIEGKGNCDIGGMNFDIQWYQSTE